MGKGEDGIRVWLETVKPGYGRFVKAFGQAGYDDLGDLLGISRKEQEPLLQHLRFCGAKAPQERQICKAITELNESRPLAITTSAAAVDSPAVSAACPSAAVCETATVTICAWLDSL